MSGSAPISDRAFPERLGHYRLESKLGAGGMGEVYKARDERLDREVAIKLLRPEALGDDSARRRFHHEAKALSRLNHPNIATIHDFDSQTEIDFLVMEFVNGVPLDQKMVAGPLPEKDAIRIAVQIARALEEAHEHNVVHRDLKPGNVILTPKGVAKVLDFGLAGLVEPAGHLRSTVSTRTNVAAGTAPYIAPEVVRGRPGDARSDIWALGVTLYEMVSGQRPFQGSTGYDLSNAIVEQDPPPLPADLSPALRTIITNCLAKRPEERYQRAAEVRAALEVLLSESGAMAIAPHAQRRWRTWWFIPALLATIALAIGLTLLFRHAGQPAGGELSLLLSSEGTIEEPALSPDGKMVVYVAEENGQFDLFLTRVVGGGRVRITNDATRKAHPSFSPDGDQIVFARLRSASEPPEVCRVPTLGGEIIPLIASATLPRFSPDGKRLAYLLLRSNQPTALAISALDGSNQRILLQTDDIYPFFKDLAWSPDGSAIAVTRSTGGMAGEIWLVPVDGGAPRRLSHDPPNIFSQSVAFASDGRGVVHSSNRAGAVNLWLLPLDGGDPVRLTSGTGPDDAPSVSRNGSMVFVNSRWRHTLLVQDLESGATRDITKGPGYVWAPAFSPDGRELAYSHFENMAQWHIWIAPLDGGAPHRLTTGAQDEIYPRFTPDGKSVLFNNWPPHGRVWLVPSDGGPATALTGQEGDSYADVSPDGRWIAFARVTGNNVRVHIAPLGGGDARPLTNSASTLPRWSPDGKWILFTPDRTPRSGVFLIRPDGSGEHRLTSSGGWPVWFPNSNKIAYLISGSDGYQELHIIGIDGRDDKKISTLHWEGNNYPVDISPDGRTIATSGSLHQQDELWLSKPSQQ